MNLQISPFVPAEGFRRKVNDSKWINQRNVFWFPEEFHHPSRQKNEYYEHE
jgi:hypothetical protein